jgi:hypothetical protein
VGEAFSTTLPAQRAFLYSGSGPMQDLNNLIPAASGWTLYNASGINDKGQIAANGTGSAGAAHALLLTPVGNSRAHTPTPVNPNDRLAEWNGTSWETVTPGSISGNVHVLVHGWAPGEKAWVDSHGGPDARIWNNSSAFADLTSLASAIKSESGDRVVAYSWIDLSATPDGLVNALSSALNTTYAANLLYPQLQAAIGSNTTTLQLIGHSHGAKVVTLTAEKLLASQQSQNAHYTVTQLTLLDSPEVFDSPVALLPGAANWLESDLKKFPIGNGTGKVFVDNYIGSLGGRYGARLNGGISGVVDVQLDGPYPFDFVGNHKYPVTWYDHSARTPSHVGFDWPPVTDNQGLPSVATYWKQNWRDPIFPNPDRELNLDPVTLGTSPWLATSALAITTLAADSNVTDLPNGYKLFTKNSPAYWDTVFNKNQDDGAIQFTYEFIQPGRGDELGIWIDDQLRFIVAGEYAGTELQTGIFDISDLALGSHTMTVALHDYGTDPAQFSIGDFVVISIPEPSTLTLLGIGAIGLLAYAWRRRRS